MPCRLKRAESVPDESGGWIMPDTFFRNHQANVLSGSRPAWSYHFNMFVGPGHSDYFVDHWSHPDPSVSSIYLRESYARLVLLCCSSSPPVCFCSDHTPLATGSHLLVQTSGRLTYYLSLSPYQRRHQASGRTSPPVKLIHLCACSDMYTYTTHGTTHTESPHITHDPAGAEGRTQSVTKQHSRGRHSRVLVPVIVIECTGHCRDALHHCPHLDPPLIR